MKISGDLLNVALCKSWQVNAHMEQMCLRGRHVPVDPRELYYAIQDFYQVPIIIKIVPKGGDAVRSLVLRRDPKDPEPSQILVSANQSDFEVRFAEAKELAHIVNDQSEDWSMDGAQTIKDYLYESKLVDPDRKLARNVVQAEEIAVFSAIEMMYPLELRTHDAVELEKGATTVSKLAMHYKLPNRIVGAGLYQPHLEFIQGCSERWVSQTK